MISWIADHIATRHESLVAHELLTLRTARCKGAREFTSCVVVLCVLSGFTCHPFHNLCEHPPMWLLPEWPTSEDAFYPGRTEGARTVAKEEGCAAQNANRHKGLIGSNRCPYSPDTQAN